MDACGKDFNVYSVVLSSEGWHGSRNGFYLENFRLFIVIFFHFHNPGV